MEPVKQKLDFSAEELESDPVRVFLRVKPSQGPSCLQLGTGSVVEAAAPKDSVSYKTEARLGCRADHRFTFSTVFAPETSQKNVFDETALPALWRFIRGEQAIVFTYGVTNSGKTFTMQGSSRDPGILPRSFDVLYNTIGSQLAEPTQVLKPVKYAGAESCDAATEIAAFENVKFAFFSPNFPPELSFAARFSRERNSRPIRASSCKLGQSFDTSFFYGKLQYE